MKARFFALAALVLGLASCQNDFDGANVGVGGEVDFQLSVNAPELATRAGLDGVTPDGQADLNSAYGAIDYLQANESADALRVDWTDVDLRYVLEVYDVANGAVVGTTPVKDRQVIIVDKYEPVTFELRLVPKRNYRFVVFADFVAQDASDEASFDVQNTLGLHHDLGNTLQEITVKRTAENGINNEVTDAYFAFKDVEITNSASNDIVLQRPYGKLRVIATDLHEINLNSNPDAVKVEYTALQPQTLNAVTGEIGAIENTVTTFVSEYNEIYKEAVEGGLQNHFYNAGYDALKGHEYENANGDVRHTHMTLFTDYILATEQQHSVHFTMTVYDDYANNSEIKATTFNTDIPVQRNYLTTVIGNVLTTATEVEVCIDDNFSNGTEWNPGEDKFDVDAEGNLHVASVKAIWDAVKVENATVYVYPNPNTEDGSYDIEGKLSLAKGVRLIGVGEEPVKINNSWSSNLFAYQAHFTDTYMENICADNNLVIDAGIANGNVVFKKCIFGGDSAHQGVHFDSGNGTITFDECTLIGRNMLGSSIEKVTFNKCYFENKRSSLTGADKWTGVNMWGKYEFNECTFDTEAHCSVKCDGVVAAFNNCSFVDARDITSVVNYDGEFDADILFDGVQTVYGAEKLASLLTANKRNISVVLTADIDLPISSLGTITAGSGEYKLGGEDTETITINLNGKTLNITTTYWSNLGAKNAEALFTIKNGTMTSSQATGTWNSYDLTFSNCDYLFEDVEFAKAVAFDNTGKEVTMNNVTINETHDYYAMWITASGQTVNIDGLTVKSAGRGIKIDEQYVGTPAKVTLNVKDANFTTKNKAAIMVKSAAGADIALENVNIANVKADTDFAVWVDEDAAAYADLVTVTGGLKKIEGTGDVVAANNTEISDAITNGATTVYLSEGSYIVPAAAKGKTVTFIGAGDPKDTQVAVTKVGTGGENCDYGLDGSNATFENITITTNSSTYIGYARCNGTYKNCIINGTYTLYGNSVFEDCTFNVSGDVYNIWTWGAPTATFTRCTFNCDGKAMLLYGTANTKLTMNNCVFNDNGGLAELKAAIEIGNDYGATYELVVNNATVNGFAINPKGTPTNTTLWANKNSMTQDKLNVVVDGVDVF